MSSGSEHPFVTVLLQSFLFLLFITDAADIISSEKLLLADDIKIFGRINDSNDFLEYCRKM